jgi:hypothetical protein
VSVEIGVRRHPPLPQLSDGVGGALVVIRLQLSFPRQRRSSEMVRVVLVQHGKAFGNVVMVGSRARVGSQNLIKSRINRATIYRGLDLIS